MAKKFQHLSNDEVFARWQARFNRIHDELKYLFTTRRKFLEVQEMFQTNERLKEIGSQPYQWILGMWGRDVVIGVRRELDSNKNNIAFGSMLDEMAECPEVLTRERYLSFLKTTEKFIIDSHNKAFDKWGVKKQNGSPATDYLDPSGIRADREELNATAAPVLEYANRIVAHRTPLEQPLQVTVGQVNAALDAFEKPFQKYHVIVTGRALERIEPNNVGDDWKETFTFPWYSSRKNRA